MIKAIRKNQDLLNDILKYEQDPNLHIWWLGQSGYLFQYQGKRLLMDPYLSDSLTAKYKDTEKPHVRISELAIPPQLLPRIDLVTSSHNHTDHLDAETLQPILQKNKACKLIIPEANRAFVANRLGSDPQWAVGLDDGESYLQDWVQVSAIPAAHNQIDRNAKGQCPYLGYIVRIGGITIYHSGDTLLYEGMAEKLKAYQPDLALLPINGNDPSRKVAGNLNAEEAIGLALQCDIPMVIPCHYDLFAFNTADVNEFISLATKRKQKICVLEIGGKISSTELPQRSNPN
jgi:L-ascorbate metabolism protein UlaG (beta-lactamase superfamily)